MPKNNFLDKKLKKPFLSINNSLENYFNNLKNIKSNIKNLLVDKDNKVFLAFGVLFILTLSYFLIPTIYDKETLSQKIKNQILNKYQIDIKFNEKLSYSLLPKPHFVSKNSIIKINDKEIGIVKDLKIYISIDKFYSLNDIEIRDLILNKTDFEINIDEIIFFEKLLKIEPSKNKIIIKNSNIFYKNKDDDLLFINKIISSKFFYDSNNLENVFTSKNKIFNIPFDFLIKSNDFNKEIFSKFKSKKIRLTIENSLNYENKFPKGVLDILLLNKDTSLKYEIKKDSIIFESDELKNSYEGLIELKPFYLTANFDYEGISTKNLLTDDSIFFDLIKSEIFDNENLSTNFNIKVKKIINIEELNNLFLTLNIEEGNLIFSNSNIMWKDDLKIVLKESLLSYDQDEINLTGRISVDMIDLKDFYSSFQIKKNSRKKIKNIEFDFYHNFDQKSINFDNVKIDNISSSDINKFIIEYNKKEKKFFNKIMFKNFVNKFFDNYKG